MVIFQVQAMNAAGQEVEKQVEAGSAEEALGAVRREGLYPVRLKTQPKKSPGRKAGRRRWTDVSLGRVSRKAVVEFTQQLSLLQDAGLPIVRSIRVLAQQQKLGPFKGMINDVATRVEEGNTLSEAMQGHPKAFDRLYVKMVAAGEAGGVLDVILQRLAEFMDKAQRLRRRVIGAMIYPSVVMTFALLIMTGIMMFVVPKFREVFRDFHTTLPTLTLWLLATGDFVANHYGWLMILGGPGTAWLFFKLLGRSEIGRRLIDHAKLKLPVAGQIVAKTAVARFARTLGTLLSAGVPILDALNIARETVGNVVFERALLKVHDAVREGESFAAPLRGTGVCDALVVNMVDVGEETGDLDKMLLKVADNYEEKVDVQVASLVSLLEPVMVVTLGGVVGTIVLALFLPLVKIMQDLGAQ